MNAEVFISGGAMLSNNGNEEGERRKKRRKKKMKKEQEEEELVLLPYLDENILTEILNRVPLESLFTSLMYVCKSWLNIIKNHPSKFPLKRLCSKPPGLIIQHVDSQGNSHEKLHQKEEDYTYTTSFIKMGKQGIEKQYDITPIFKKLQIRACCNGLVLATPGLNSISTLYVINPLTKHQVMLPPHPLESDLRYALGRPETIKFIFIPSTGDYRVVMGGFRPGNKMLPHKHYVQILTLSAEDCFGSASSPSDDSDLPRREWRIIEVPERLYMYQARKRGVLLWSWGSLEHITFDVDTKTFCEISHPGNHGQQVRLIGFMKMGGFLTSYVLGLLHRNDDAFTLSVRVLKDIHTGEWIHQYSARIDPDFMSLQDIQTPVLSFGNGEVIIFRNIVDKSVWAYNVVSHRWWEVGNNLEEWDNISLYDFHVNNNVTLESLYSNWTMH